MREPEAKNKFFYILENQTFDDFQNFEFGNYDLNLPSFESDINIPSIPVHETIHADSLARVQPPIKCEPVPGMS